MMLDDNFESTAYADVYIASVGNAARDYALMLAEDIRDEMVDCRVVVHCSEGKLKRQMKKADASDARVALIIGENEVSRNEVTVKLLATGEQQSVEIKQVPVYLKQALTR